MSKNLKNKYRVRGTEATYRLPCRIRDMCDLKELAEKYRNWENVPVRVGTLKAQEISLLANAYLCQVIELQALRKRTGDGSK